MDEFKKLLYFAEWWNTNKSRWSATIIQKDIKEYISFKEQQLKKYGKETI